MLRKGLDVGLAARIGWAGGVAGLVNNHAPKASLDKVKSFLDAEMKPKCDLLCKPCHGRKTYGYPRRAPVA